MRKNAGKFQKEIWNLRENKMTGLTKSILIRAINSANEEGNRLGQSYIRGLEVGLIIGQTENVDEILTFIKEKSKEIKEKQNEFPSS